jgi:hypothetical protein
MGIWDGVPRPKAPRRDPEAEKQYAAAAEKNRREEAALARFRHKQQTMWPGSSPLGGCALPANSVAFNEFENRAVSLKAYTGAVITKRRENYEKAQREAQRNAPKRVIR